MSDDIWEQRLGFWNIAQDRPDLPAIVHSPDGEFTYGELAAAAHQLVHTFRGEGIERGAIVGLLAPNGGWPVAVQLACQEGDYSRMLVNSYLTAGEMLAILEHASVSVLILHEQYRDLLDTDEGAAIRELTNVWGIGDVPGVPSLEELRTKYPTAIPDDLADGGMISYSSGTTGLPKGIVREGTGRDPALVMHWSAVFGRAFDFRPFDGPSLVSTAMYHGGSASYYIGALNVGHALVIMPRFDAEGALQLIEKYRVRSGYMVATQFHRMLQLPDDVRSRYDLSSLHSIVHSAAPCPRPVKEAMLDWWGPVIWETYGGMEGAATIAKPHRWLEKPGTVGRAVRGVKLAIFDDDGNELGPNETGHIYFKTEMGFSYHADVELTSKAFRGDMFTIGDIGYLDEDGYLFIQDRAKDMIISGGVNIFPAEIEGVLLGHPAVYEAAVIGVPDDEWGERVLAVVELRDGVAPSDDLAAEILDYCAGELATYKRPKQLEFRSDLPRTEAGKLLKRQIRDEYWTERERAV